jgi:hypothetical protein
MGLATPAPTNHKGTTLDAFFIFARGFDLTFRRAVVKKYA